MEPADQRRDDQDSSDRATDLLLPQWSPPTSGETTGELVILRRVLDHAAMEPADQRRDDIHATGYQLAHIMPQWSPPTSGGTTRNVKGPVAELDVPQWSPPTSGGTTPVGL